MPMNAHPFNTDVILKRFDAPDEVRTLARRSAYHEVFHLFGELAAGIRSSSGRARSSSSPWGSSSRRRWRECAAFGERLHVLQCAIERRRLLSNVAIAGGG